MYFSHKKCIPLASSCRKLCSYSSEFEGPSFIGSPRRIEHIISSIDNERILFSNGSLATQKPKQKEKKSKSIGSYLNKLTESLLGNKSQLEDGNSIAENNSSISSSKQKSVSSKNNETDQSKEPLNISDEGEKQTTKIESVVGKQERNEQDSDCSIEEQPDDLHKGFEQNTSVLSENESEENAIDDKIESDKKSLKEICTQSNGIDTSCDSDDTSIEEIKKDTDLQKFETEPIGEKVFDENENVFTDEEEDENIYADRAVISDSEETRDDESQFGGEPLSDNEFVRSRKRLFSSQKVRRGIVDSDDLKHFWVRGNSYFQPIISSTRKCFVCHKSIGTKMSNLRCAWCKRFVCVFSLTAFRFTKIVYLVQQSTVIVVNLVSLLQGHPI